MQTYGCQYKGSISITDRMPCLFQFFLMIVPNLCFCLKSRPSIPFVISILFFPNHKKNKESNQPELQSYQCGCYLDLFDYSLWTSLWSFWVLFQFPSLACHPEILIPGTDMFSSCLASKPSFCFDNVLSPLFYAGHLFVSCYFCTL